MNNEDLDRLLEQASAVGQPRAGFREQVLRESAAAFVDGRRNRVLWHTAARSVAAVLIAGVSFLLGRCSLPQVEVQPMAIMTPVAAEGEGIAVPSELVAWLDAARLFRQLGMEDRMARAIDHAYRLRPYDKVMAGGETGPVFAAGGGCTEPESKQVGPAGMPGLHRPVENVNRILAQFLGD